MEVYLYNSTICRLCGEENENGTLLYSCEENDQNLSEIINTYLPIKVFDDGQLPRTICPGCTIQLEATVEFLNLIINGQKVIRELHHNETEYRKSVAVHSSAKESEVITEKIVYEINTSNGVYQVEHPISLQVQGFEKPKRKRGRPPKKPKTAEELAEEAAAKEKLAAKPNNDTKENEEPTGKRRRKAPTRFKEVVQGKELERMFKEEGVIDGEDSDTESKQKIEVIKVPVSKEPEVIGHLEDSGEPVVVVKGKGRGRPKGRTRQTREECAICGMTFTCVGRYMSHVAQHGPVMYQCQQCSHTFATRLLYNMHQSETGHSGQVVIPCHNNTEHSSKKLKVKTEKVIESNQENTQQSSPNLPSVQNLVNNVQMASLPGELPDEKSESVDVTKDIPPDQIGQSELLKTLMNDKPECETSNHIEIHSTSSADTIEIKSADISLVESVPEKSEDQAAQPLGKPKLKCNHCDKMFSNRQSKSLHIKAAHQGERPYVCGECGDTFAYPRSLALHSVSHRRTNGSKGFACDLCGKVLNHPSSIVYHKESEHAGQRYVCGKCGKGFKHKQLLQRHQLVHSQLRPYICKTCDATFKTKANLINHQLLHTGVKKFACVICNQMFAHKTSLTLHMRWHTGSKPYTCDTCGKSFSQKGNLSEHERIHTGERPYACGMCSRRFTTSSQRRLHVRRHVTNRPYPCARCGRRFTSLNSWTAHVCPETGVCPNNGATENTGPHKCGVCKRGFTDRRALLKHARRHPGERPYCCPMCPRTFTDCSNLNKHKRQIHKQISLLVNEQPEQGQEQPENEVQEQQEGNKVTVEEQDADEERVIYVAYDVDDADATAFHILDPEQAASVEESKPVYAPPLLVPASPRHHMPVTDEQGNPLHFTMQDGTRLAITSADGQSLQVITQDGQTIPVEINGFSDEEEVENPDTIVHHLDLQKSVDTNETSPVTYFTIV